MQRFCSYFCMRTIMVFCLITVVMVSFCLTCFAIDPVKPAWTTVGCSQGFTHCSNVTTKEEWSEDGNFIYFFLEAIMSNDGGKKGNTTVWYLGEHFDSYWAEDLGEHSFNVVNFFPRGSEKAYPQITCDREHYNNHIDCQPDQKCVEQIANSGLDLSHYSIAETAKDLEWVLKTLGANTKNVVVAEGLGSFIVQRMLKQATDLGDVSVILAGFTDPVNFDIFSGFLNYDEALFQVFEYCERDKSSFCVARLGASEGVRERFENVLEAAKGGTLKCNNLLNWDVKPEHMHIEYRAIVAALLRFPYNFLLQPDLGMVQLIPSFIYRLQRCNDGDRAALTHLYKYVKGTNISDCPAFIPQRYNWLVNDLNSYRPPPTLNELVSIAFASDSVYPHITVLKKFFEIYEEYPKYDVSDRTIEETNINMLLLPSGMDPVYPLSLAEIAANVYKAPTYFLPHQNGFPVSDNAIECIRENLLSFRLTGRWADRQYCELRNYIDFTQMDAYVYYGVSDMWDFTEPNKPEILPPPPSPSPTHGGHSFKTLSIVLGIFLMVTLVALLAITYIYWSSRRTAFTGDFYSNLKQ